MTSSRSQRPRSPHGRFVKAGARFEEHRLANGLRVLLAERHLDPVVAVLLWYGAGARDEREHEAGVSHFLEHMMFKGSARYGKGEVDRITTTLGGSNNAFTTPDHTAYWFELASDRWQVALEIEADRMRRLTIDPGEFEAEKAVVLEELAMGEDDPWRNLSRQVQELLFTRHPYRRPVIGYPDALARMTPELMRDYYARFYRPANALLLVCGDVEPKAALAAIRRHFGRIPDRGSREREDGWRPELDVPRGERRLTTSWDDQASRLVMAWPTVNLRAKEDAVLDVLATVLSVGRLSRFHRRLVLEEGLATTVVTNSDTRVDGGCFWIMAEATQGTSAERLERAIDEELERLARDLVPAPELRRAKAVLAAAEAYDGETVTDLAEEVGEYAIDAHWTLAFEVGERRAGVSAKEIRECAQRFLARERRVVGWSLPRAPRVLPDARKAGK